MGKTLEVAAQREHDKSKIVLPAEVARGIYIHNAPSAQCLKLLYLLCAHAGRHMGTGIKHEISLATIRQVKGMRNHDRASLRALFIELRGAVLVYDDPKSQIEIIGGFVDEIRLDYSGSKTGDLVVQWWYGRSFIDMAEKSDLWALLDRQTLFSLKSKYSILLFQHIASLVNLDYVMSKKFTVDELRGVMGLPDTVLSRFADFNSRALTTALAEINQISRFDLSAKFHKKGKAVVEIEIGWEHKSKESLTATKKELAASKVGRKARRDGTAESPVLTFPASGGLSARDPSVAVWRKIFDDNVARIQGGQLPDSRKVCDAFRRAVGDLSAVGLEKRFAGFCKAWRG